jgi:hypothetical protein
VWKRLYEFHFVPIGFFSRLIVKVLHLPGIVTLDAWREGMYCQNGYESALLKYTMESSKLGITVKGTKKYVSIEIVLKIQWFCCSAVYYNKAIECPI